MSLVTPEARFADVLERHGPALRWFIPFLSNRTAGASGGL